MVFMFCLNAQFCICSTTGEFLDLDQLKYLDKKISVKIMSGRIILFPSYKALIIFTQCFILKLKAVMSGAY